jgi:hypothetical protein
LCVWDCVAQTEKINKTTVSRRRTWQKNEKEDFQIDSDREDKTDEESDDEQDDKCNVLLLQRRKRPTLPILHPHVEADSHVLRILAPDSRFVPVPIGPALPR